MREPSRRQSALTGDSSRFKFHSHDSVSARTPSPSSLLDGRPSGSNRKQYTINRLPESTLEPDVVSENAKGLIGFDVVLVPALTLAKLEMYEFLPNDALFRRGLCARVLHREGDNDRNGGKEGLWIDTDDLVASYAAAVVLDGAELDTIDP